MIKKAFFLTLYIFISYLSVNSLEGKQTVCLNMIIKDEKDVITRCLATVKPVIDYWVIVDTGSTDGSQEIVKNFMKDIPGELHETPWVNFEYNRNDALQKAKGKGDYILIIDADEILSTPENFKMPELDKDFYFITTKYGGTEYLRVQLINNHINWKWIGVVHEALDSPEAKTSDKLLNVYNIVNTDGARSKDPLKYQKDALILEEAVKKEPNNSRYMFYLAQSWKDAGEYAKALENYKKRVEMGGFQEEVFWSKLQIAHMQRALNMPPETFLASYYDAYHFRNTRAEPLYFIANYYRTTGNYAMGYLIADTAYDLPPTKDILMVMKNISEYEIPLELSICAYWTGRYHRCRKVSNEILKVPNLPENVRECVERNLGFNRAKLLNLYEPKYNPG